MDSKKINMEINKRFFKAFDALMISGRIVSLNSFCEKYDLYRGKYSRIRSDIIRPRVVFLKGTEYKSVDLAALAFLVRDFNVSADWVLTGRGEMFE